MRVDCVEKSARVLLTDASQTRNVQLENDTLPLLHRQFRCYGWNSPNRDGGLVGVHLVCAARTCSRSTVHPWSMG